MHNDAIILAGSLPRTAAPLPPFSPLVLTFLQALSEEIRHYPWTDAEKDWSSLGFWLRKKHIDSLKSYLSLPRQRIGRGIAFHITPTNMPTMCIYSFVISLLAGNNNIVRISPRLAPAVQPICTILQSLLRQEHFRPLYETNVFLSYPQDKDLTDFYTNCCDIRLIWGGNDSISNIRKSPLPPQATELVFADRYSLAIFDAQTIAGFSDDELQNWAHRFYIDTYDADQNACSSPRLICWLGDDPSVLLQAQHRWWHALAQETPAYDLAPIKVSRKYADAWSFSMTHDEIVSCERIKNEIYVYTLARLPENIDSLSGAFGQFFQLSLPSPDSLIPAVSKKVQTISTIGISQEQIRTLLITHHSLGADRIVSTGEALSMSIVWDGTNLLEYLSRIIS